MAEDAKLLSRPTSIDAPDVVQQATVDTLLTRLRANGRRLQLGRTLVALATIVLFLLLWEGVVRWRGYPTFILPRPIEVWNKLQLMLSDGSLYRHTSITLAEILLGLALGLTAAVILGYFLAKSATLERLLSPYIVALQAFPIIAIAPLLVIWVQDGTSRTVLICALTLFFPALVNTIVGIRSVEPELGALMRSLRATRWQVFAKLEAPAAMPVLLGGLKVGATLAVIGAVIGEFVGADRGLGFLINLARGLLDTPMLFVAMFTLVAIALGLYSLISLVEHRLLAWKQLK